MQQKKKIEIRMNKINSIQIKDKVIDFFRNMDFRIGNCEKKKQFQDKIHLQQILQFEYEKNAL